VRNASKNDRYYLANLMLYKLKHAREAGGSDLTVLRAQYHRAVACLHPRDERPLPG
jgi:hypothetical protein